MKKDKPTLSKFNRQHINHSFTGTQLTNYAGLSPIMKYLNRIKLGEALNKLLPTVMHNSTRFTIVQIMLSLVLASFTGMNHESAEANRGLHPWCPGDETINLEEGFE